MWLAFNIIDTGAQQSTSSSEVASILLAIAAIVAPICGVLTVVYTKRTNARVSSLDKSVNGVPEGTLPLVQRVLDLEHGQERSERRQDSSDRWLTDALKSIGGQLGVHLPDRRDYDSQEA